MLKLACMGEVCPQTVVLFRYTVDFLLREHLIRPNGDLIGLAPVVTALFEREPDNLVRHCKDGVGVVVGGSGLRCCIGC